MAEAQPAAPDTVQIVTGETMQAFTEARMAGEEFKPEAPEPEAKPEAKADAEPGSDAEPEEHGESEPHVAEPEKELTPRQIKANKRWKDREEALNTERTARANAEAEIRALRAKYEPAPEIPQSEPDPAKYEDAKVYAEDYSNWKDGQRRQAEAQAAEERQRQATWARFEADRNKFKSSVQDWDERATLRNNWKMPAEVIDHIMESDFPAQIMYELSEADVNRINALPKMREKLREITRMEAKIAAGGTKSAPAAASPAVEVSKAPPPINPLKGNAPATASRLDKDGNYTGSQEQYEKDRREGKLH